MLAIEEALAIICQEMFPATTRSACTNELPRMNKRFYFRDRYQITVLFLLGLSFVMTVLAQTTNDSKSQPQAAQSLGTLSAFFIGLAGALAMYLYWFRTERLQKAIDSFHTT